ncbi:MAG: DUF5020 family protein [Tannerellaceae bacterium]|jgi:hypothetical protein|nr:DUF5020 family protein [Tannerellaceae bacterium]
MKKVLLLSFAFAAGTVAVQAQNIQLHYDFGSALYKDLSKSTDPPGRPALTTTVEHFVADKWGSTFFFVDMDYQGGTVASAYWEIARELTFWQGPITAHIEYNGGLNYINDAYLAGATYTYNSFDFSKGYSLSLLYKGLRNTVDRNGKSHPHSFQITGVWHLAIDGGLYDFTGFIDFWKERDFIFLSEPQFWVNLNKIKAFDDKFNLSVGTEVEVSNNFAGRDGFYVIPTLAAKWHF